MLPFIILSSNEIVKLPGDGFGKTVKEFSVAISLMPVEKQSVVITLPLPTTIVEIVIL